MKAEYTIEKDWTAHGLRCVALAGRGHRCGYVAVPPGHPLHGTGYDDVAPVTAALWERRKEQPLGDDYPVIPLFCYIMSGAEDLPPLDVIFDVHGGLTYADGDPEYPVATADGAWWFGFDCGHAGDAKDLALCDEFTLEMEARFPTFGVVRDLAFVVAECEKLAAQLAEVADEQV